LSNQAVTLLLVARTKKGWRRMPVAFGRKGKIPGSYYALRHFEGSKTVWTTVGENATDALAAHDRAQHLRQAKKLAVKAGVTVVEKNEVSHTLLSLKKRWLQKLEARGKRRAVETMTIAIDDFWACVISPAFFPSGPTVTVFRRFPASSAYLRA
jgi:CO dehydrogenase/acetyl-CoA synthase beta subunit